METSTAPSKNAIRAMVTIVIVLLLVAIYATVQKNRRRQIESATFAPAPSASPAATTR